MFFSLLVCLIRWRPSPLCRRIRRTSRSFNTMQRARSSLQTAMIPKTKRLVTSSRSPIATTIRQRELVIVLVPCPVFGSRLSVSLFLDSPRSFSFLCVTLPVKKSISFTSADVSECAISFFLFLFLFLFLDPQYQLPSIPPINHFSHLVVLSCNRRVGANTPHTRFNSCLTPV